MLEKPVIAGNTDHAIALFKLGVGAGLVLAVIGVAVVAAMSNDKDN